MKTISIIFNYCINSIIASLEQFLAEQFYKSTYVMDVKCDLKNRKFILLLDLWVDEYGLPASSEESLTLTEGLMYLVKHKLTFKTSSK